MENLLTEMDLKQLRARIEAGLPLLNKYAEMFAQESEKYCDDNIFEVLYQELKIIQFKFEMLLMDLEFLIGEITWKT